MRSTLRETIAHLKASLDVPVYASVPSTRPAAFVVVVPVGGNPSLDALHSDYALQAWATDAETAEPLIRACCDAMRSSSATPYAAPVPLGADETHVWWQATFTVHALW